MEQIKAFYEALAKDQAMQERAKELKGGSQEENAAAIVAFAAKEGYAFSAEELTAYIEGEQKNREGALSDSDLEGVAGGAAVGPQDVVAGAAQGSACFCILYGEGGNCACIWLGNYVGCLGAGS